MVQRLKHTMDLTVLFIALIGLVGWFFKVTVFFTWLPGFVPMQANTAIGSIFALLTYTRLRNVAATILIVFCGLTLSQDICGYNLGIDAIFAEPFYMNGVSSAGRMAPNTATSFIMFGLHRLFVYKNMRLAAIFLAVVLGVSFSAVVGYVFDLTLAYKWFYRTGMALPTSISLLMLAISGYCYMKPKNSLYRWVPYAIATVGFIQYGIVSNALYGRETQGVGVALALFLNLLLAFTMIIASIIFVLKRHAEKDIQKRVEELQSERN